MAAATPALPPPTTATSYCSLSMMAVHPLNDYVDYKDHFCLSGAMGVANWTVAQAKARLSELIEQARSEGPQTITKHGRTAAVVVSAEEWERKSKRTGNLAEFFAGSPLRGSEIDIRRRKDRPRKVGE